MKSTTYITEITAQKNKKYLFEGRKLGFTCLLASYQLKSFLREFTEKCFAVFDQSSRAIYLSWLLLFFREFSSIIPLWYHYKILVKSRGGGTFLCLALSVNVRQQ